jgi:hypothetical protein
MKTAILVCYSIAATLEAKEREKLAAGIEAIITASSKSWIILSNTSYNKDRTFLLFDPHISSKELYEGILNKLSTNTGCLVCVCTTQITEAFVTNTPMAESAFSRFMT